MDNHLTEWRLWSDGIINNGNLFDGIGQWTDGKAHNEQPFDGTGGGGLMEWYQRG